MKFNLAWDENKRKANLEKHGLDFSDAEWVMASPYRLDVPVERNGEARIQSFAYMRIQSYLEGCQPKALSCRLFPNNLTGYDDGLACTIDNTLPCGL